MAVKLITTIQRWVGISTDDKPTPDWEGSTFKETDTGKRFIWTNSAWVEDFSEPLNVVDFSNKQDSLRRLMEEQLVKSDSILTELMSLNDNIKQL